MKLRKYDLNLIPILESLLRHRNVTRASEELGLSQSATSHALMRLREQYDDQLLKPHGRKMLLTPLAEQMLASLRHTLDAVEGVVEPKQTFDPASSTRRFKLGMADYVVALVLPKLLGHIEASAPGVSIQIVWVKEDAPERLRTHQIDLALLPRGFVSDATLHSETLFTDELVVIAAKDHPELADSIDIATYQRLPHVLFRHNTKTFADIQAGRHPLERRETLLVADFLLLPFIVSETRCIALTHRSLAQKMQKVARLKILEPPFQTDQAHIDAFWSVNVDPGIKWLRHMLKDICDTISEGTHFEASRTRRRAASTPRRQTVR